MESGIQQEAKSSMQNGERTKVWLRKGLYTRKKRIDSKGWKAHFSLIHPFLGRGLQIKVCNFMYQHCLGQDSDQYCIIRVHPHSACQYISSFKKNLKKLQKNSKKETVWHRACSKKSKRGLKKKTREYVPYSLVYQMQLILCEWYRPCTRCTKW